MDASTSTSEVKKTHRSEGMTQKKLTIISSLRCVELCLWAGGKGTEKDRRGAEGARAGHWGRVLQMVMTCLLTKLYAKPSGQQGWARLVQSDMCFVVR